MYCRCGHESAVLLPLPHREGWGGSYTHDCTPNVVAMAVRIVITMLRILPQVLLLLNVPIVVNFEMELNLFIKALLSIAKILHKFGALRDRAR